MMYNNLISSLYLIFILTALLVSGCKSLSSDEITEDLSALHQTTKLSELWYDGNAELNTYTLDQNRYRETHPGESVLVQVTEHLDKAKHVKSDQASTEHSVPVMKTNLIERFHTGLYDYSLMTSVFTSTQAPFQTLKVTFSSQDWCGQSFSQLNWKNHEYYISKYSYFESIGDEDYKIGKALLEDEIFNLIRISPKLIPLGTISLIPSFKAQRLMHIPAAAITANITSHVNKDTTEIIIEMPEIKRVKTIEVETKTPHRIFQWTDTYPSLMDKEMRTSSTELISSKRLKYWELNSSSDRQLPESLLGIIKH